jgi:hypothetical protein
MGCYQASAGRSARYDGSTSISDAFEIYCKGTAFEIYCRGTYEESRMLLYSSTGWIPSSSALLLFLHCQVRLVLPYLFLFSIVCQLLDK